MTFLILFLALVIGIFIGVFLFGEILKLRKKTGKKSVGIIRLIVWGAVAAGVTILILMIYPYGVFGFLCGMLIGIGCDLYTPVENNDSKE